MMKAIDIQSRTQAQPPMTELDDLVSKDMNKLSMEERENALHDVHGIVDTNRLEDEPSELVDRRLQDLIRELDPIKRGTAYETAERISQNYVGDRRFRLAFLRAESFDAKRAAHRMIRHFEEKKSLFGEEKLTKDIALDDLDEEDINTMEAGYLQVLPVKDRSDRRIIAILRRLRKYRCAENAARVFYYVFHSVMEEEDVQKRGVVCVFYHIDDDFQNDRNMVVKCAKVLNAIPIKIASFHLCHDEPRLRPLVSLAMMVLGSYQCVRYRSHFGSHTECLYELLTFGICYFPAKPSGKISTQEHMYWLRKRYQLELRRRQTTLMESNETSIASNSMVEGIPAGYHGMRLISTLSPRDVLFGRGAHIRDNQGNARFRKIVDEHRHQYEESGRLAKGCLAGSIVGIVKASNGRFLKLNGEGGWEEVKDNMAREKVHHTFRNFRKQK